MRSISFKSPSTSSATTHLIWDGVGGGSGWVGGWVCQGLVTGGGNDQPTVGTSNSCRVLLASA